MMQEKNNNALSIQGCIDEFEQLIKSDGIYDSLNLSILAHLRDFRGKSSPECLPTLSSFETTVALLEGVSDV